MEKNEIGEACSTHGLRRDAHRVLVGNPEGKRLRERPRRRRKDNIKIIFRKYDWGAWTGLIRLRTGAGGGLL
jgi:hypothetical protein